MVSNPAATAVELTTLGAVKSNPAMTGQLDKHMSLTLESKQRRKSRHRAGRKVQDRRRKEIQQCEALNEYDHDAHNQPLRDHREPPGAPRILSKKPTPILPASTNPKAAFGPAMNPVTGSVPEPIHAQGPTHEAEPIVASEPMPLFEIRKINGKGLGTFALRYIARGTRIMAEEILMQIPWNHNESRSEHVVNLIIKKFDGLCKEDREAFLALYHGEANNKETDTTSETSKEERADSVIDNDSDNDEAALRTSKNTDVDRSAMKMEDCAINTKDKTLDEPDSELPIKIFWLNAYQIERGNDLMAAVCKQSSRLNHSCLPNVFCSYNEDLGLHTVHAVRDITIGEEILTSYCHGAFLPRTERMDQLSNWGFECDCPVCQPEATESNKRRTRMRELHDQVDVLRQRFPRVTREESLKGARMLEELVRLMEEEDLTHSEYANM